MNRREALQTITVAGTGVLVSQCSTHSSNRPPNIIFIMTDDQTVDQMSCYGHTILQTPNMDRLANEGIRFNNCYCTNSLCAPSRASILTGCYSSLNGITGNSEKKGSEEQLNPDIPTFPELLQQTGYYTAIIGKYHLRENPRGFDEWRILPGQGSYFNPEFIENGVQTQNEGYVTDVITDKTVDFLNRADSSQPFCLIYQHKAPHRPFTPAPRHAHLWEDVEFPYPETFDDDYSTRRIAGLAQDMKIEISLADDYDDLPENLPESEKKRWIYQRFVKDSCRAVVGIDENLGRVLNLIEKKQIADDTLIFYTSDNGFFLGEHGWYDKRFMYEPSLRIPLLIRYPRLGISGQVSDNMVLNVDVAPTILDAAGVPVPKNMHGRSLLPILGGKAPDNWRKSVYYSYYEDSWRMYQNLDPNDINDRTYTRYFTAHRVGPHRGVRTERYKLIEYYTENNYWELFDLETDPNEVNNLYGQPGYEKIIRQLKEELKRLDNLYGTM
ncbi:MAG: sulfatase [Candidatus Latescibacteria bacterium]|nr:sulfatase [Candidatus Latescibacterota bacterium]